MATTGFSPNAQHQHQHQHLYQQQSLRVDTKPGHAQNYFDDEDDVLDESILDSSAIDSGLELSPHMVDSRRESVALGGITPFSPATKAEDWHSAVDMQSLPSNNPFYDQPHQQHSNNPFAQAGQFQPQGNMWNFQGHNGGSDFATDNSVLMMPAQMPFAPQGNIFGHLEAQGQQAQSLPPHSGNGLSHKNEKSSNPVSPALRAKGDGIRKKNARFDIPQEHTLANIDILISQEKCEKKIKELKSHKRLLRNRQAALDSRQRKKQHTERLEDEKKQYSEVVSQQELEIEALRGSLEAMMSEKQQYLEYVHRLQMEKDEMIASHTNETGELRRKITVLTEHVRRVESSPPTAAASNPNEFTFADMPDLSMGGAWEHSNFIHEFPVEAESKQEMAVVKKEPETDKASSQQGGLLFMLFLVGAFVLSNKSAAPIPRVSDDVRVASAELLDSVLKDAGISGTQTSAMQHPLPSHPAGTWNDPVGMPLNSMGMDESALGDLGNSLTQPTQEQANEQLFSLSAADYNGVSNPDFLNNAPAAAQRVPSQGRRNLNDALAALRVTGGKVEGAAEVYTRSLLWDQIPSDIVRDFAKMVAESNAHRNDNHQ